MTITFDQVVTVYVACASLSALCLTVSLALDDGKLMQEHLSYETKKFLEFHPGFLPPITFCAIVLVAASTPWQFVFSIPRIALKLYRRERDKMPPCGE